MFDRLSNYESFNNILLIEDNPGDARLVEILLEESDLYDCEIVNKTTLADGLKALEEDEYSAVLLDLTLPDSKGFETLEQLIHHYPNANVIVMTGLAAKELGIKAVKVGAQDFLVKGDFDSDQLSKTLRYSIERNNVLKRLEQAQRIAHIGNWDYNMNTEEFNLSDEVFRIFGYKPGEDSLTRKKLVNHLFKEDIEALKTIYRSAMANQYVSKELRIINTSGETRYISVICSPSRIKKQVNKIEGIAQDITERKLAQKELFRSQERYQAIFSQTKDAIYISSNGKLVDFNKATEELFGYTVEELKNIDLNKLFKDATKKQEFDKAIDVSFVKDFEIEILRKDGTSRLCLLTASQINTDDFQGYNGILRDVTEHRQTEKLKKAKELAERSAMMKEKFMANVSHEMRTPMNAILGLSNLLLKTSLQEEQENYLKNIKDSSQLLLGIINNILEISSINEGEIKFEEHEVDLKVILESIMSMVEYRVEEKNLKLTYNIESNVDPVFLGDKLRTKQILMNLIVNAVKFTEKGFVKVNISKIQETREQITLKFEVMDSGIGMPEDKLDDIFEAFMRIRSNTQKQYSGTGLGLAIVKQLVQMQNGTVRAESELGKGSTFVCEIPFKKGKVEPEVIEEEQKVTLNLNRKVNILLVEDHKLNQIVARKTLEKEWDNVVVTIADNGKIAIEKLEQQDFDLILMDIQMPVMDGYEATKYIREQMPSAKANTTIFAMTAHVHMAQDDKFKEYGMDDCVLKPFEPKILFEKIAYYINKQANSNQKIEDQTMNGTKLIDLSYMDMMADGDDDMKKMMLELLFEEPLQEIKSMYKLVRNSDLDSLGKVSHKMKSTLAFVGNDTLTNTNKEIERISKFNQDTDKLPDLVKTLDTLYQQALVELKSEHAKL